MAPEVKLVPMLAANCYMLKCGKYVYLLLTYLSTY